MTPRFAGAVRRAAAAIAISLLAACAAPQSARLSAQSSGQPGAGDGALPSAAQLTGLPFFAQEDYQCGPAALAIAMGAAGRPVEPADLVGKVFLPAREGSLQAEVLAAPRRSGLLATRLPGTLQAILSEVASGTPVIVFQNLALDAFPRWHYAVLIGYDLGAREAVLHSGTRAALRMSLDAFERTWTRAGSWAVAVTPPSRLPASATEGEALRAAVALERVDPAAAATAYEAVLGRWAGNRVAMLGRANAARAAGEPARAIALYREAVAAHPDFADAWNNLADALIDAGRPDEAREAIGRALAIGGPRRDVYERTASRLPR